MQYRRFGRTGWKVSEIGYGMWGMGEWKNSDDDESENSLDLAVELGCNFFDTAWAYGDGKSEKLLGRLLKRHPEKKLYTASKLPPKNREWPAKSEYNIKDVYPPDYIKEYTEKSLKNIEAETIDLMQFHVWDDSWADDDGWQKALQQLKEEGKIRAAGISINRWEPENAIRSMETGIIDAVQVIYNIFDQAPEDKLFPKCKELDIAVIARVPFDEGTLTGNLTMESKWPEGDWRNTYFVPENLKSSVEHGDALKPLVPEDMTMAEMALKFILANDTVSTVIPGMRKAHHVRANLDTSGSNPLSDDLMKELGKHRWDRQPTWWSQ